MSTVHVIGAGLAGLAAAVRLAGCGMDVRLYEAAGRAGGRCRSYYDQKLGCVIDNGNHLLLSGNRSALSYLRDIGAEDRLLGRASASLPFLDLETNTRWSLELNKGRIQKWVFSAEKRIPGTRLFDYMSVFAVLMARPGETVSDRLDTGSTLFKRFWNPLIESALNTPADKAAISLLRPILTETFLKGAAFCRPLIARSSLADSFVDPALSYLEKHGAKVHFNQRASALEKADGRITAIKFGQVDVPIGEGDMVVLATPLWIASQLLEGLSVPAAGQAIVNVHYRLEKPISEEPVELIGLVGGLAHWVFVRSDVASVTISAADHVATRPAEDIAMRCWTDVAKALHMEGEAMPAYRVVKEKRATFDATPASQARRPKPRTAWSNLLLAGDWTDTGLPSTIEGAIRSGHYAADHVLNAVSRSDKLHGSKQAVQCHQTGAV